jgi:hypothetical protein
MACGGGSPAEAMKGTESENKAIIKRPEIFIDDLPFELVQGLVGRKISLVEVRIEHTNLGDLLNG